MKLWIAATVTLGALLLPRAASAQTTGVYDMGIVTGAAALDTVTLAEEKRSGTGRYAAERPRTGSARSQSAAKTRAGCARRPEFRARFGASDPGYIRLDTLCRKAGY